MLIESISGIRGIFGQGLDASVLVRYGLAYGRWLLGRTGHLAPRVVVGRDARESGEACAQIVIGTLRSLGLDVFDAGLATTPTVAMAVLQAEARGGIILSASHNPEEWNALKLLSEKSELLTAEQGAEVRQLMREDLPPHGESIGSLIEKDFLEHHVDAITAIGFVDKLPIMGRGFKVLVDGINSVGGVAMPRLLQRLGVQRWNIKVVNGEPTGRFAHPAEPLPENLTDTMAAVREAGCDLGVVVDPDADRLALIDEEGNYVSEELTQVIAADFMWRRRPGPFVTNLSSSRAIDDLARQHDQEVYRSAVGEINVVQRMHEVGAILGGEGNGGVIVPDLHHGRDALVATAIVLQHLAEQDLTLSRLRERLPSYVMAKKKVQLSDPVAALARMAEEHEGDNLSTVDGVKLEFEDGWVHMRTSNTEPIVRVYAESTTAAAASSLATKFVGKLEQM